MTKTQRLFLFEAIFAVVMLLLFYVVMKGKQILTGDMSLPLGLDGFFIGLGSAYDIYRYIDRKLPPPVDGVPPPPPSTAVS